ncbi:MAG: zinc ribbon domain-containing protein [Chloroflexia bacterium]
MLTVLDGGLLVALVLFAFAGVRRGAWPEVVTLGGLLLGALLADEWGEPWGGDLAGMAGFLGPSGARMVVRGLLFLVPLLVVGYGGALLLPKGNRPGRAARLGGGLLGLFNGSAILGLLLRNWHYSQGASGSPLTTDPITNAFLEWAGWWPVLLAAGGLVAVLTAVVRRPRTAPKPAPQPVVAASVTGGVPSPTGYSPAYASTDPFAGMGNTQYSPGASASPSAAPPDNGTRAAQPSATPVASATAAEPPLPTPRPVGSGTRRCRTCSEPLAPGAAFCTNCGTPVT